MLYADLGTTGCLQCHLKLVGYIVGLHGGAQFPSDDVTRLIIEDGREIEPALADHFEVDEVCLPKLIDCCGFVTELIRSLDDGEGQTCNQVECLEYPVHGCSDTK